MSYTDRQIKLIKDLRNSGLEWEEVADKFNDEFYDDFERKSANAMRKTYDRYRHDDIEDDTIIKNLKTSRVYARSNAKLKKENNKILDNLITIDGFLKELKTLLNESEIKKYKIPKVSKSKVKRKAVVEAVISDLHVGLKTKSYDYDILRKRLQKYSEVLFNEIESYSEKYQIEFIQILALGDIIQSATMHKDSKNSCHLTNAEQLAFSVECIFNDVILPIALTGHKIKFLGICGNHDREASDRFTANPGITYFTYTIYKTLEMLCEQSGLVNVEFEIPTDAYSIYEIFGHYFLAEHGYLVRKKSVDCMENMLVKRSTQHNVILSGIRIAHFHEDLVGSQGRYIVNGSTVSDDHFGNGLGYKSRPSQLINYYIEDNSNETSYNHSFSVNLE